MNYSKTAATDGNSGEGYRFLILFIKATKDSERQEKICHVTPPSIQISGGSGDATSSWDDHTRVSSAMMDIDSD
jgi:hypothetical protein